MGVVALVRLVLVRPAHRQEVRVRADRVKLAQAAQVQLARQAEETCITAKRLAL